MDIETEKPETTTWYRKCNLTFPAATFIFTFKKISSFRLDARTSPPSGEKIETKQR